MAGALTERDFVAKLERAGFVAVEVLERRDVGIDDLADYPLFPEELVAAMRRLVPRPLHARLAVAVVVRARRR